MKAHPSCSTHSRSREVRLQKTGHDELWTLVQFVSGLVRNQRGTNVGLFTAITERRYKNLVRYLGKFTCRKMIAKAFNLAQVNPAVWHEFEHHLRQLKLQKFQADPFWWGRSVMSGNYAVAQKPLGGTQGWMANGLLGCGASCSDPLLLAAIYLRFAIATGVVVEICELLFFLLFSVRMLVSNFLNVCIFQWNWTTNQTYTGPAQHRRLQPRAAAVLCRPVHRQFAASPRNHGFMLVFLNTYLGP